MARATARLSRASHLSVSKGEPFRTAMISAPDSSKALRNLVRPHVLADHRAQPHVPEIYRTRKRARSEKPLLVENSVIGQIVLETDRRDAAAVDQQGGVVQLAVPRPGRASESRRPAVGGLGRERAHLAFDCLPKDRPKHEVFRRIAGNDELAGDHQISAEFGGARPRAAEKADVARHIAHSRVELGQRDIERIGHETGGASTPRLREPARARASDVPRSRRPVPGTAMR